MQGAACCIVLAGGLGTRLRSVVADRPKCLAPVQGRAFLWWQLHDLARRGVGEFVLSLGYQAQAVQAELGTWPAGDFTLRSVVEPAPLGTGGAALLALHTSGRAGALLANGDSFVGGELTALAAGLQPGEDLRMAVVRVDDRSRFGGVQLDAQGRVSAFIEKGQGGAGLINAGLYQLRTQALLDLGFGPGDAFSLENQVLPVLAAKGRVRACELPGPFIDIGVPADYARFAAAPEHYTHPPGAAAT